MKQVLLVGSGGVGTIVSLNLERSGQAQVTSVIRSDYQHVKEKGFQIESIDHGNYDSWRPSAIVPNIDSAKGKEYDYIVVCTKVLPEVQRTEELIAPVVTKGTTIVLIQNGIMIEDPVAKAFPDNAVLSGVSIIGSHNFGGKIVQDEHDSIEIGYFDSPGIDTQVIQDKCKEFVAMYAATGVDCKYSENLQFSRWRKLIYNSAINTICALTTVDIGRAYLCGLDENVIRPAMHEVRAIAKAAGYELDEKFEDHYLTIDDGMYFKPSMQVDVEKGNMIELEVILGNPLRVAKEKGVDTPVLSLVYNLLRSVQFRLMEGRGLIKVPEKPLRKDPPLWK